MHLLFHAVIVAVLATVYFRVAVSAEFRGGWRLAMDVVLMVTLLAGGFAAFAVANLADASYGIRYNPLIVPATGLMLLGVSKLLFLIVAPCFPMRSRSDA